MAVGLLLLAACGTADELAPGRVPPFVGIAGKIYERQGTSEQFFFYFFEDGTWHGSSNRDLVVERPTVIIEYRFEGTTVFLHETKGSCDDNPDATYEIHLLENGNLRFVVIEDPCAQRSSLDGSEFAPVP